MRIENFELIVDDKKERQRLCQAIGKILIDRDIVWFNSDNKLILAKWTQAVATSVYISNIFMWEDAAVVLNDLSSLDEYNEQFTIFALHYESARLHGMIRQFVIHRKVEIRKAIRIMLATDTTIRLPKQKSKEELWQDQGTELNDDIIALASKLPENQRDEFLKIVSRVADRNVKQGFADGKGWKNPN